ncbi:hypothetical protein Bbelb_400690 [Branchiostoma belcheri]|nr:hypothetical protein Bbelb_400690 [Branchiostoma belcheri]
MFELTFMSAETFPLERIFSAADPSERLGGAGRANSRPGKAPGPAALPPTTAPKTSGQNGPSPAVAGPRDLSPASDGPLTVQTASRLGTAKRRALAAVVRVQNRAWGKSAVLDIG